jgi:hypothetical protein
MTQQATWKAKKEVNSAGYPPVRPVTWPGRQYTNLSRHSQARESRVLWLSEEEKVRDNNQAVLFALASVGNDQRGAHLRAIPCALRLGLREKPNEREQGAKNHASEEQTDYAHQSRNVFL